VGLGSKNMHFTSLIIHGQLFPLGTLVWVQLGTRPNKQKMKERKRLRKESKKKRIRMKVFCGA
jgi:hypothetical protein